MAWRQCISPDCESEVEPPSQIEQFFGVDPFRCDRCLEERGEHKIDWDTQEKVDFVQSLIDRLEKVEKKISILERLIRQISIRTNQCMALIRRTTR